MEKRFEITVNMVCDAQTWDAAEGKLKEKMKMLGFKEENYTFRKSPDPLTRQQEKALHLYCGLLAKAFNDGGWTMKKLILAFEQMADIHWSKEMVKEFIVKPLIAVKWGYKSTKRLKKDDEITELHDEITNNFGRFCAEPVAFPSKEGRLEARIKEYERNKLS